jgi:TetR/AcrR family transcriptional regulator
MARPRGGIDKRIIRAARKLFLRDGVDGASLREIAKRARTNIGMVYYYFPAKDDLFLAIVEDVYPELLADLTDAIRSQKTAEARVRALYRRIAECSDDELDVIRLVVREALVSSERLKHVLERFLRGHIPIVLEALGEGVEKKELLPLPLPALMMATLALGIAAQVARRLVGDLGPFAALPQGNDLAQMLADVLFDGIRSNPT